MGFILHRRLDWMPLIPCQQPHLSSRMILFWCIFLCLYLHLMLMESCFSFLIETPWEAAATIFSTHPKLNSPQHSLYWHFSFFFFTNFSWKFSTSNWNLSLLSGNISLFVSQILHPLILTAYLWLLLFCFHARGEENRESGDFSIAELSETRAYCPGSFSTNISEI